MRYGRSNGSEYTEPPAPRPPRPEHDHCNDCYHRGAINLIRLHATGRHTLTARQLAAHLANLEHDAHNAPPHRAPRYAADLEEARHLTR